MAFFDLFIYYSLVTLTSLMLSLVPPSHTQGTPTIPSLPQESIFLIRGKHNYNIY